MKHSNLFFILIVFLFFTACKNKSDMETLREKIGLEYLAAGVDDKRIEKILETIRDDGTWPGINYTDTSRIAFEHARHLDNMEQLARAYKKEGSKYKGDKKTKQSLEKALDYWLKNDFICENWWNNQIGTPSSMLSLLYILDKDLTKEQTGKMIEIANRANMDASGARPSGDRVKIAALLAKNLLFQRNEAEFDEVIKIIEGEMKLYSKEVEAADAENFKNKKYFDGGKGLQADYSFHHRADRVNNTTSYGLSFLSAYVEFAELVNDTKYKFSDEKVHLAVDYFLDGVCKQMIYGRVVDPGVMNRDITRPKSNSPASPFLPEALIKLTDYRRSELENIVHARKGEPFTPESYAKFFWQTEHFVFQRPTFYTSVRMYSTRNKNMEEAYNGEGLTNHYRADGANYLSSDGNEYLNIVPVFNFRKIPGTTVVQAGEMPAENLIQAKGLTDFVGAVTDGMYGAVVFDFRSPHDPLSARKAWFFFDNLYVCLGADINSIDIFPAVTTLNQCYLRGDVTASEGDKNHVVSKGDRVLNNVKWVFHDNTGYIFPVKQKVGLSNQTQSGSWFKANRQTTTSKEIINKDVFTLWVEHGINPSNGHYEYIVMPAVDIRTVEKYIAKPTVTILSNTKTVQSVKNGNIAYFILYEPGKVNITDKISMASKSPCMIMVTLKDDKIETLTVSDPSRKLQSLELTLNDKFDFYDEDTISVWDETGKTTKISIKLPQDSYAGKSKILTHLKD